MENLKSRKLISKHKGVCLIGDVYMSESKVYKCYHCGLDIVNDRDLIEKKIPLAVKNGTRNYRRKFHFKCYEEYRELMDDKSLRQKENTEWDQVYQLFKTQLGVRECNSLDQHAALRLAGLRVGKYIPNGNNVRGISRGYSFETILNTLRFCNSSILHAMSTMSFKNQKHKIDYAMRIVTNNINFIDQKTMEAVKTTKNLEKIPDIDISESSEAKYVKKAKQDNKKVVSAMSKLKEVSREEEANEFDDLFV